MRHPLNHPWFCGNFNHSLSPNHQFGEIRNSWACKKAQTLLQRLSPWWRREWDSNPRYVAVRRFSRPFRYNHFGISPNFDGKGTINMRPSVSECYYNKLCRPCQCKILIFSRYAQDFRAGFRKNGQSNGANLNLGVRDIFSLCTATKIHADLQNKSRKRRRTFGIRHTIFVKKAYYICLKKCVKYI